MFRRLREGGERRREEQEKLRLEAERTRWLTIPIKSDHGVVGPPPSFEDLANRAIQRAGADVEFDYDAVVAYWSNFLFAHTVGILERSSELPDAVHGLQTIQERDEFEPEMVWAVLAMQGTKGGGLHMFLAEDIQADGFIDVVAIRIRRGELCNVEDALRLSSNDVDKVFELGGH